MPDLDLSQATSEGRRDHEVMTLTLSIHLNNIET